MKERNIRGGLRLSVLTNEDVVLKRNQPAFLFVHGMCGNARQFKTWIDLATEQGLWAYALDLRGHGQSGGEIGSASINDYAGDVKDAILQIGEVFLVGHSMGGLISQVVCQDTDMFHLVRKVVLLSSTPPAGIKIPFQADFLKPRYLWAMAFGKSFRLHEKEERLFRGLKADCKFGQESGKAVREMLLGKWRVKRLSAPTLVVAGTRDGIYPVPSGVQQKIARLHGALYREADTGHMTHCELEGDKFFSEMILPWCLA